MNDKLWKFFQYASIISFLVTSIITFIVLPKERLPDGGWQVFFPSPTFQHSMLTAGIILTLIWIFATYVRKEGEISGKAVQRSILFIVGFGIFFIFLKPFNL